MIDKHLLIGCKNKNYPIARHRKHSSVIGFTIVELLVVIVVIGILATITIVSYTGITQKANESTIVADLANAKNQFALYYTEHSVYPTGLDVNNCPTNATVTPNPDTNYCLKSGSGNTFAVTVATGSAYALTATKGTKTYKVTNDSVPIAAIVCPTGFIVVPGSSTYGTSDFCVMKYEAKNAGSNIPASVAAGTPWLGLTEMDAATYSANVVGCTGCHLITEAEWMTIAQNVLSVTSNWSGGAVGSGFIYSGHNDGSASGLAASTDNDGYYGTGNTTGSNQRRTLTLTNGEVIWDLAGNISEWTANTPTGGQPGITGSGYTWLEWTAVNNLGTISPNPSPAGTGLAGASTWTSASNGIGKIYSSTLDASIRGTLRGGAYVNGVNAGVLMLDYEIQPSASGSPYATFRVTR